MPISKRNFDKIIGRIAANDPILTQVFLSEKGPGDDGAARIAAALEGNTHVTALGLWNNDIGPDGAIALAGMLSDNSTITALGLSDNGVGDAGATALADALLRTDSDSAVATLGLSSNGIGPDGARALAGMLSDDNSALTALALENNDIGDAGAAAFEDVLHTNFALTKLSLDRNNVADVVEYKIGELLRINGEADSREEARGRKIKLRIEWMVDDEDEDEDEAGARYEAAVALALEEMGSHPEQPEHRRELFRVLLGSTERGEDVAASVETAPRGRALYRYAADCGAPPAVLMKILRAHPSLCGACRDLEHKLYPFMLLATLPDAEVGDVMELLLQCPSLVVSGIGEPIGRGKRKRV